MSRRALLLMTVVASLVVGGVVFVVVCFQRSMIAVRDSYIEERVAEMIEEHLERNGGVWPRSWDELEEAYEIGEGRAGGAWSLDEIRECCGIDFDANPEELVRAVASDDTPPFKVVYLRSGATHYWSGGEPNRHILEYLHRRAERPADYVYPSHLASDEQNARRGLLRLGAQWQINKNGRIERVHMGSLKGSSRFNDGSLLQVAKLSELKELILCDSDISDAGMPHLAELKNLRYLDLSGTRVTDGGLQFLSQMESWEQLSLAFGHFTDRAFEHLVKLRSLKLLNMNYTDITDEGAEQLRAMKNLDDILVGDTFVTAEEANSLKSTFPNARIYHSSRLKASK